VWHLQRSCNRGIRCYGLLLSVFLIQSPQLLIDSRVLVFTLPDDAVPDVPIKQIPL